MMLPPPRPEDDPRRAPVWLRRELLASGLDDPAITALHRSGVITRVRRGAYVATDAWAKLDADGQHGLRVRASVANAQVPVVVSHVSGLPELGVPTWGLDMNEVHLTRLDGRAGRIGAGVHPHRGAVDLDLDVVEVNGLPVMHPARLALEVTTCAPLEPALCVLNDLLHRGITTPEELSAVRARMTHWPHSLVTDLAVRLADPRIENLAETRAFFMCWRQGLPRPVPQYEIRDANGIVVHRVDFAWPELGVYLEFDGKVKYERHRRPGESVTDVVLREKRREEWIGRITEWRCIRITWADLAHPERTAAIIRAALFPSQAA